MLTVFTCTTTKPKAKLLFSRVCCTLLYRP